MPTFQVTSPDGTKYEIDGPAGATQQDAIDRVRAQLASKDIKDKNYGNMSVGKQVETAIGNIPESAKNLASSVAQPFIHPVQTATDLGNIGKGVMQKLGIVSGEDAEPYADAVGKYLMDKYGSGENIRKSLIEDPVGVAADVATVFTGGGSVLAKAPGVVGKVGEIARAIDPVALATKGVVKGAGLVGSEALGQTTGVGGAAVREAYRAGAEGGEGQRAFLDTMRGNESPDVVVDEARKAVTQLRLERGAEYTKEMAKIGANDKVLDFDKIDEAVDKVAGVQTFKGQVINKSTEAIRNQINDAVEAWKQLDPKEYHTAEGLDALKRQIGDIGNGLRFDDPGKKVVNEVYNAIKGTIVAEEPKYAKVMKGYDEATTQIKEIERELTGNPRAPIGPALRKITSALRNNVNTNYGKRAELVGLLVRSGAPNLLKRIAGSSLSSATPRGMAGVGLRELAAGGAGLAAGGLTGAGLAAAGLVPLSSPRLVGEAARAFGVGSRYLRRPIKSLSNLGQSAFQSGTQ